MAIGSEPLLKSSALLYFLKERLENAKARLLGREEADYFASLWCKAENRAKVVSGFDKLSDFPYRNVQVSSGDNVHPNALGHGLAVDTLLQSQAGRR
jgi:hypothetical protein